MTERIRCLVPFCGRTIAAARIPGCDEWICSNHWRGVSRRTKTRRRQVDRRRAKLRAAMARPQWLVAVERRGRSRKLIDTLERPHRASFAMWCRCKAEAIEAAAGIAA